MLPELEGGEGAEAEDEGEEESNCWEEYALLDLASKPFRIAYGLTIPDMEKSPRLWPLCLLAPCCGPGL